MLRVSSALGVPVETLAGSLPGYGDDHEALRVRYLWDRLYPDLVSIALALNRFEPQAVARLVQVDGLYVAERILGRGVWSRFDQYKHHIHPGRRQQLEGLVRWRRDRTHS